MRFEQINYLVDEVMPKVSPNAYKVIMAVARQTWGWGEDSAELSNTDLMELTGIGSKPTIIKAINDAASSGFLSRERNGRKHTYAVTKGKETKPLGDDEGKETKPQKVKKTKPFGQRN